MQHVVELYLEILLHYGMRKIPLNDILNFSLWNDRKAQIIRDGTWAKTSDILMVEPLLVRGALW